MIAVPVLELLNFNTMPVLPPGASETMLSVTYGMAPGELQVVFPDALSRVDVTGFFCTSGSEREFTLEGSWYADEEIQAGADRDVVATG